MSQMFPQLDAVAVQMSASSRERQLGAISQALSAARRERSRFRLLAVAIAVLFVLPVLALAAEDAKPGDFLYPVRQVLPWSDPVQSDPAPDRQPPVVSDRVSEPDSPGEPPPRTDAEHEPRVTDVPSEDVDRRTDPARDDPVRPLPEEDKPTTRDRPPPDRGADQP